MTKIVIEIIQKDDCVILKKMNTFVKHIFVMVFRVAS